MGLARPRSKAPARLSRGPASDDTIAGRVMLTRQPYHVADIDQDLTVPALSRQMIEALGTRSQVTMPMLRAGEPIGAITVGWASRQAFDDQEMALLKTFADQAVIAIQNARLFKRGPGGARRRRGRQRGQELVPRDHEPRDPHADERRDRHERPAARHAAHRRAARLRRHDPRQRRRAADDHQRHPRLLEDRGRADGHRVASVRPARVRRVGARPGRRARPRSTSTSPTSSRARCRRP